MKRNFILGIAILMVIIYHLFCWVYNPLGRLNIGYVGVDIFLFFSGFGLTYSFTKNNLKEFYKRRLKKIYPLYLIVCIIIISITTQHFTPVNRFISDSLLKITTLSYYLDPENSIDWYLNSLFLFYLIFPLLYKLCKVKGFKAYIGLILIYITFNLCAQIFFNYKIYWKYDCFLARIPIFCLGIIHVTHSLEKESIKKIAIWSLLPIIPLYSLSPFFSISLLAPLLLLLSNKIAYKINLPLLEYIGKHTLELYCANLVVWNILLFTDSKIVKLILFIVIQIITSAFLIYLNRIIQSQIATTGRKE